MPKKPSVPPPLAVERATANLVAVTPVDVAKICGVTKETVMQWIYHRQLPATRIVNGHWRISVDTLQRFVDARMRGPKQIVFVAARPEVHALLQQAIDHTRLELLLVNNPVDGLLKLSQAVPPLVILDTGWPGIWTFGEQLRERKATANVTLLLLTDGTLTDEEIDRAVALGANACVKRSSDVSVLKKEIARCLS